MTIDDELGELDPRLVRQSAGVFKLKDKSGRNEFSIKNNQEEFMVLSEVRIKKVEGENKFEVILILPDPELVEVSWKPEAFAKGRTIEIEDGNEDKPLDGEVV